MSGNPPFPIFTLVSPWVGVDGTTGSPSYSDEDLFFNNTSGGIESYENQNGWSLGYGAECNFTLKCQDFVRFSVNDQAFDLFSVTLNYTSQQVQVAFRTESETVQPLTFSENEEIGFEYRVGGTTAEVKVYQSGSLALTFSTNSYSFPANDNYYKIVGGNGYCGCLSFQDYQEAPQLEVTFTPSDIGVEQSTTSVSLEASTVGGVEPYTVSWLRNGSTLLSNDNPYDFPVTVADIGQFVLGRVVDNVGAVVEQQLDIVEGGFRWITEPSDYSGAVGSTMPVVAGVGGGAPDLVYTEILSTEDTWCDTLHEGSATGRVYAGIRGGTEAIFKYYENGVWTDYFTYANGDQSKAILELANGDVLVGTGRLPRIFLNKVEVKSWETANAAVRQLFICGDNIVALGEYISVGAVYSTDGGLTWNNCTGSSGVVFKNHVVLANNVVLASAIDGVYKSTDCGVSWVKTSSPVGTRNTLMQLSDTKVVNTRTGSWVETTNAGETWQTYTGAKPFNEPYLSAYGDWGTSIGDRNSGDIGTTIDGGLTWVVEEVSSSINRVVCTLVTNSGNYAGGGTGSGDANVYKKVSVGQVTYALTLKDNLGASRDTQVSTDGNYSYDALNMQSSDSGTWTLEAENNGKTITSPFNVSITALSWLATPTNPTVVNLGENLNIQAQVSSENVDWLLTRNGVTIDNRIDSTSTYNFTKVSTTEDASTNWVLKATVDSEFVEYQFTVDVITSQTGYGLDGNYGEGCYKSDTCIDTKKLTLSRPSFIEQYKNSYTNSKTDIFTTIPSIPETNTITVGSISTIGLIEQYKRGYING